LIELVSPHVPDLTIIDLPGIVRTTLEGQSRTVIAEVDSLLQKFLEQERTIILAVIPSNVDIATVDIIERASKADPRGHRTVGVLTKPDMIGAGEGGYTAQHNQAAEAWVRDGEEPKPEAIR
jgi:interferon-induced GTP-binding protein Mx1